MLDDEVWRYLPVGPVPALVMGVIGFGLLIHVTRSQARRSRVLAWCLLGACVVAVLAVTNRGSLGNQDGGFSWQVGHSIAHELGNINRELGLVNVLGNVLMFVPVGWLAAVVAPRRPVVVGVVSAGSFSVAIEVWQMLSGSFGDIDDIVLNSVGGLLGAALAWGIQGVRVRRTSRARVTPVRTGR